MRSAYPPENRLQMGAKRGGILATRVLDKQEQNRYELVRFVTPAESRNKACPAAKRGTTGAKLLG